jgi:hypothetical protein
MRPARAGSERQEPNAMTWSANPARRRFVKGLAGAAAGGLLGALPLETVLALTRRDGGASAVGAPRVALVVGNASYTKAARLDNPVNDARGMARALQTAGFSVDLVIDAQRAQMTQAIDRFVGRVGRDKAVGLFYFAGHGMQFSWRNYLLPVDASIARMEEVTASAIDVNGLIEGIGRAANPMNVIILDACRENPFGRDFRVPQPGLSQLDAPPGTLLAYATAPGHVAIDGDGTNGLYTEQLLREIPAPEAKIEDVFKRVRLAVRRKSNGRQIPWESTSLEEDFYFFPPAEIRKLGEDEARARFEAELAEYERIQEADEAPPLEDYLRRYPSGRFSELVQLRLDQVLARAGEQRVQIVQAPDNPYTKGSAHVSTAYKVGDSFTYRLLDLYTGVEQETRTLRVTKVTDTKVIYNGGRRVSDLLGNPLRIRKVRISGNQNIPAEFALGKRWSTRWITDRPNGREESDFELRVTARETISVPAGSFDCFKVEFEGLAYGPQGPVEMEGRYWMAPDKVRQMIAQEILRKKSKSGKVLKGLRRELVAYQQS